MVIVATHDSHVASYAGRIIRIGDGGLGINRLSGIIITFLVAFFLKIHYTVYIRNVQTRKSIDNYIEMP